MLINNSEYIEIVNDVKAKISEAQHRAVLAVNHELMLLYWNIGSSINDHSVWGNKFIENLARDIKHDFPDMKGYSVRNLKYMAKFAKTYPDLEFVQRTVAQIPWRHNIALRYMLG
jgi:predicted nuclease of restriction endonuclease-like (RecB) superfamily